MDNYQPVVCKDCKKPLGEINWKGLQPTDEVRCTPCATKDMLGEL